MLESAEKYLIQVLKHGSSCRNMDELLYYIYHHSKGHSFIDLPATTYETRGHSLRALINTYQYLYAMISECLPILDPREYGYEENDGLLIPSRYCKTFPDGLWLPCNCPSCATSRCSCHSKGIQCCEYCKCGGDRNVCKNTVE